VAWTFIQKSKVKTFLFFTLSIRLKLPGVKKISKSFIFFDMVPIGCVQFRQLCFEIFFLFRQFLKMKKN